MEQQKYKEKTNNKVTKLQLHQRSIIWQIILNVDII